MLTISNIPFPFIHGKARSIKINRLSSMQLTVMWTGSSEFLSISLSSSSKSSQIHTICASPLITVIVNLDGVNEVEPLSFFTHAKKKKTFIFYVVISHCEWCGGSGNSMNIHSVMVLAFQKKRTMKTKDKTESDKWALRMTFAFTPLNKRKPNEKS